MAIGSGRRNPRWRTIRAISARVLSVMMAEFLGITATAIPIILFIQKWINAICPDDTPSILRAQLTTEFLIGIACRRLKAIVRDTIGLRCIEQALVASKKNGFPIFLNTKKQKTKIGWIAGNLVDSWLQIGRGIQDAI